jgi:hypothetical protein
MLFIPPSLMTRSSTQAFVADEEHSSPWHRKVAGLRMTILGRFGEKQNASSTKPT